MCGFVIGFERNGKIEQRASSIGRVPGDLLHARDTRQQCRLKSVLKQHCQIKFLACESARLAYEVACSLKDALAVVNRYQVVSQSLAIEQAGYPGPRDQSNLSIRENASQLP